jgi:GH24 family phage-related lysozyme (muramidase)
MPTYLDQSIAQLKLFEGCVPWMYLDTVGKVTVGVGLMLPNVAAACALAFTTSQGAATPAQIAADFNRVFALARGKVSAYYRSPSSPELPQSIIDAKLLSVLTGFESTLRTHLPNYDALPDPVKLALLDMAYNLGPAGLLAGYPHLIRDVEAGAWAQAAATCQRRGPSPDRNAWTQQQFLSAIVPTLQAEAESWLSRLKQSLRSLFQKRLNADYTDRSTD